MEIKAKINKPYTDKDRLDFLVENNHNKGYEIRETETELQAWGLSDEEKKREYLDSLSLSPCDVELALYKAIGMDFEDLKAKIKGVPGIDIKALAIELKRGKFERQNPYVKQIGSLLGYSDNDLDYLFENKQLPPKKEL